MSVDAQLSQAQGFAGKCCAICFDDNDCDVIELQCGGYHRFHRHCITPWVEASLSNMHFVCPICRRRPQVAISGSEMRLYGVFENTPAVDESHAAEHSELPQEFDIGDIANYIGNV